MDIDREVRKIEMIYEAAAGRIMRTLLGLDVLNFTEAGAMGVREKVDATIRNLNRAAARWLGRSMRSAYGEERQITENRLLMMGAKRNGRRSKGHSRTMKRLIDRAAKSLVRANESIRQIANQYIGLVRQGAEGAKQLQAFSKLTTKEKARIADLVDWAFREGEARGTLRNKIMDYLRSRMQGDKFIRIVGKDGIARNYKIGKYIELVARTELRQAASAATEATAREYDHDLIEIPAKGGSCEECIPFEGKVYSLSGDTPGYPVLEERPPYHPRCRHYERVVSETSLKWRKGGGQ